MVDYWIQALISYMSNFIGYIFNLPIIQYNNSSITLGKTFLYFALAGIIIRFIFNAGGSLKWFEKD